MESNPVPTQPTPQASVQQTPVSPAQPVNPAAVPSQPQNVVTDQEGGGSKKVLWIIIVLVLLALLAGGYWMMNRKPTVPAENQATTSADSFDNLNTELELTDVNMTELESDLTALDKDLTGLD